MNKQKLLAGLYLVSTPIGAARDITLRALDILASADILAAEDTRNTRKLLDIHGVALNGRRIIPYHDHNGSEQRPRLLAAIADGQSVAYVSDAGTPLIADPGFTLGKATRENDLAVFAAPGASAVLAALCVSGMPTDRFLFAGFIPNKQQARETFLSEFKDLKATLVFYESPKRILNTLDAIKKVYGDERQVAMCRELTKKFEQVVRGDINTVQGELVAMPSIKGEIVLVLSPPVVEPATDAVLIERLNELLSRERIKDASQMIADEFGVARKRVYALALTIKNKELE